LNWAGGARTARAQASLGEAETSAEAGAKEESGSKLFLNWACGVPTAWARINKVVLLLFVHKK
jgi:hypothetical protein